METKWQRFCMRGYRAVLVLLAALTGYCIYASIFNVGAELMNTWRYKPLIILTGSVVYIEALVLVYRWTERRTQRQLRFFAAAVLVVMVVGLVATGTLLKNIFLEDIARLHVGAVDLAEHGRISPAATWYFSRYPYQQAAAFLLAIPYSLRDLLGVGDYRIFGMLFNVAMMMLSVFFAYRTVLLCKGPKAACLVLVIAASNPIFYLLASYYYTDSLCMPFMTAGVYCALLAAKNEGRRKIAYYVLTGFITYSGMRVRATVGIVLVAILIILWTQKIGKQAVRDTAFLALGVLLALGIWGAATQLWGADLNPDDEFPPAHFIMMGLSEQGDGRFSSEMELYTYYLPTYQEKVAGSLARIKSEVTESGLKGMCSLMLVKLAGLWTDGYGLARDWLATVERYGGVYEYTVGSKGIMLGYIAQFARCSVFLCMPFTLAYEWRKKRFDGLSILFTAFFGTALFYLVWQSTGRFALSFVPILIMMQAIGIAYLVHLAGTLQIRFKHADHAPETVWDRGHLLRALRTVNTVILVLIFGIGLANLRPFVGTVDTREEIRVLQRKNSDAGRAALLDTRMEQTFTLDQPFNCVKIRFLKPEVPNGQVYVFELSDETGQPLSALEFRSDQIKNNAYYSFAFDTVHPVQQTRYTITLYAKEHYQQPLTVCGYTSDFDPYEPGHRILDGQIDGDMVFTVTETMEGTFVSKRVYTLLWGGSLLLVGLILLSIRRAGLPTCAAGNREDQVS